MIDESLKNQYKSIKAPESLKSRIMADCENAQAPKSPKTAYKYIQVIAACLVACLCIGFVGMSMSSSTVYLNGEVYMGDEIALEQNVPSPAMQRAAVIGGQVIEVDAKLETKISISAGEFTLLDSETSEIIYSGNEYSVKGKVIIEVSLIDGENAEITLQNILSSRTISLENNS